MSNKNSNNEVLLEDLEFTAKYIRENSSNGKFIKYNDFFFEPINLNEEDKEIFFDKLFNSEEFSDIKELKGKKTIYFYSEKEMTDSYAQLLFRIEEKDLLKMIAQTVRYNSKRYPKTTSLNVFLKEPYCLKKEELSDIINQYKNIQEYKDIKETKASNGVVCLYSEEYLTRDYATALTEWAEVIREENP